MALKIKTLRESGLRSRPKTSAKPSEVDISTGLIKPERLGDNEYNVKDN